MCMFVFVFNNVVLQSSPQSDCPEPNPDDLPMQLAKKELEGAMSVDGVEATLLRVRFTDRL